MIKERKIQMLVNKYSLTEAEEVDDLFWSNATVEENLNHMYELRKAFYDFGEKHNAQGRSIKKVVNVISKNEK